MKVYIAGPINSPIDGLSKEVLKARFYSLAEYVQEERGWETLVPLDVPPNCEDSECLEAGSDLPSGNGHAFECWMRADLKAMLDCDAILLLPGWQESNGARIEAEVARMIFMPPLFASLTDGRWDVL